MFIEHFILISFLFKQEIHVLAILLCNSLSLPSPSKLILDKLEQLLVFLGDIHSIFIKISFPLFIFFDHYFDDSMDK